MAGKVYRQQQSMKKGGVMKTYDDFGKDYDAFTDYVMDRISLEERRKIRKDWGQSKSKMQWQDYLLKEVKKKSMAKGGEIDEYIVLHTSMKPESFIKKHKLSNYEYEIDETEYDGFNRINFETYPKNQNFLTDKTIKEFYYEPIEEYAKGGEVLEYSKILDILTDKIDDAVEDIESTYEQATNTKGEEVESKSRSGFIPFTNGGYSSKWFEYSDMLEGSGMNLPTASLDEKIEEFRERNREYGFERFEEEYPEIVEELGGIENVNYSALEDAGYSNEADDLDMFMQDDEESIMMKVEAFYYTPNNDRGEDGKHTIQLSGVVNLEAPYHRSGNLEDYIEERFTFDTLKELEDKLDKGLAKVVSWFEGDMYDKNPRELKIRRMKKGGKTKRSKHSLMQDRRRVSSESWEVAYQKRKSKMEAGGTLPTPFGQAGLVGETGAMNEMDLFAMGGGLPQGVHQYYANTYNPAYPTPHGYAKGGTVDVRDEGNMAKTYDGRIGKITKVDGLYYTLKFKDGNLPYKLTLHQKDVIFSNSKFYAKGGKIRKSPFKVGDMVYSYQNPNDKMRVSFVEDRGVEDGVDYGWGYKVALKTDENGKYDPKGKYSQSSKWMSQNSVSKTKKTKYAKGGRLKTYKLTDDTYVNIFLSRGFKPKRSGYGLKFFQHKPSSTYITYDPKGRQSRVIVENYSDLDNPYTIYEGDTMSDLMKSLDKEGIPILFEPYENN